MSKVGRITFGPKGSNMAIVPAAIAEVLELSAAKKERQRILAIIADMEGESAFADGEQVLRWAGFTLRELLRRIET